MTLQEYLESCDGQPWRPEDTAWVLNHVREVERSYHAVIAMGKQENLFEKYPD